MLLAACGGDSSVDPVEVRNLTLTVEPTKLFLGQGQDGRLHARLVDESGRTVPMNDLSWRSSNPSVATVDEAGNVSGVATGSVIITASSNGKKQDADVNVRGKGRLELHLVSGSGQSGPVGEMLPQPLVVEVRDDTGAGVPGVEVDWKATGGDGSTSAPSTTTNQNGLTQVLWTLGPAMGGQTVQAQVKGAGKVEFAATGTPGTPATVTVSPETVSIDVGADQRFVAAVTDKFGNAVPDASVVWASTAADVVQVDAAGVATGMTAGQAVVEAYAGPATGGASVEVTGESAAPEVAAIAASHEAHTFTAIGQSLQLDATAYDGSGEPLSGITFTWSSTDASIAAVDDMGLVIAKAVGMAYMIVSSACCQPADTVAVTVTQVPATVNVTPATLALPLGDSAHLLAEVYDAEGTLIVEEVSWTSSDPEVVSVDALGVLTGLALGTATVEARAGEAAGSASVEITTAPTPSTIVVTPSSFSLHIGETQQLTATVLDSSGEVIPDVEVSWSSTAPSVASIDLNGVVTALDTGSVGIEARLASPASSTIVASLGSASSVLAASSTGELVGVANATVEDGPAQSLYPNRPSDMVVIAQWDGTSKSLDGWGTWGSDVEIVADADNPLGNGSALQFNYDAGSRSAGVLTADGFSGGPFREIYIMYRIKYDPEWELIGHKNFYWGAADGSRNNTRSPTQYYTTFETSGNMHLTQQNVSPTTNLLKAGEVWTGKLGKYVSLEIHAVAESSPGAGDGEVHYYHDGLLIASNTNVRWVEADDPVAAFDGFQWYTNRNTANTVPSWFRVGELMISGR